MSKEIQERNLYPQEGGRIFMSLTLEEYTFFVEKHPDQEVRWINMEPCTEVFVSHNGETKES
jgi:hypothetical protein